MYFNKIWFLTYLYVELSIFTFFRMPARGAHNLKLASEKPQLALGDGL